MSSDDLARTEVLTAAPHSSICIIMSGTSRSLRFLLLSEKKTWFSGQPAAVTRRIRSRYCMVPYPTIEAKVQGVYVTVSIPCVQEVLTIISRWLPTGPEEPQNMTYPLALAVISAQKHAGRSQRRTFFSFTYNTIINLLYIIIFLASDVIIHTEPHQWPNKSITKKAKAARRLH